MFSYFPSLSLRSGRKQYMYLIFINIHALVSSASTTKRLCSTNTVLGSQLEIQCLNYKDMLRFNEALPPNITMIDLSLNYLTGIDSFSFSTSSKSIRTIFLNANRITKILEPVFQNFPNLQVVDFTNNIITELGTNVFYGNNNLKEINLKDNALKVLNWETFKDLTKLEIVKLEGNYLENCTTELVKTLMHFQEKNISVDISLCEKEISKRSIPENHFRRLEIPSGSNHINHYRKDMSKYIHFSQAFILTVATSLGILSVICILLRRRSSKRQRKTSEDCLIEEFDEKTESGYLTPKIPNPFPVYLEIFPELKQASTMGNGYLTPNMPLPNLTEVVSELKKSLTPEGNFENNFVTSSKRNFQELYNDHHYEEIKVRPENPYSRIREDLHKS